MLRMCFTSVFLASAALALGQDASYQDDDPAAWNPLSPLEDQILLAQAPSRPPPPAPAPANTNGAAEAPGDADAEEPPASLGVEKSVRSTDFGFYGPRAIVRADGCLAVTRIVVIADACRAGCFTADQATHGDRSDQQQSQYISHNVLLSMAPGTAHDSELIMRAERDAELWAEPPL